MDQVYMLSKNKKTFLGKLWAILKLFARFKWKFFEYSHANGTL